MPYIDPTTKKISNIICNDLELFLKNGFQVKIVKEKPIHFVNNLGPEPFTPPFLKEWMALLNNPNTKEK